MIVFDLKCGKDHVFEAWFGSSGDFEAQQARGLMNCPLCGDISIAKAVMAPRVGAKGNSRAEPSLPVALPDQPSAAEMKAMLAKLAKAQTEMLASSEWVGGAFAEKARAMHLGETAHSPIHGQVSRNEAQALQEEGVPVAPLPFPVVPPESRN